MSEYAAVLSAGFEGAEAARIYRALADFALSWAGGEAGFLSLDARSQEVDRAAWTRAYRAVDRLSTRASGRSGRSRRTSATTRSSRRSCRWSPAGWPSGRRRARAAAARTYPMSARA